MAMAATAQHAKRMSGDMLVKRHKKRINDSTGNWQKHWDDLRDYVQPYRTHMRDGETTGRRRTSKLFDSTAVVAAWRGSHKLRNTLTPDFKDWFRLVPGPFVKNDKDKQQLALLLDQITEIAQQAINQGDLGRTADEFYQDLYAGTGVMLVLKGSGFDQLLQFIALPAERVEMEDDASGVTRRWMFLEKLECGKITERWPDANLPQELKEKIRTTNGLEEVEITIAATRQDRSSPDRLPRYDFQVCYHKDGFELWHEEMRTSPFVSGRFFKVPGETRGRGPAMLALPHIKTLNKAVEMQLKAAAFAVLGAWMTSDDGVYNPRTSLLVPGGMLKVKSTGGRRGASIADLGLPKQFDVTQLVSAEMRGQIKEIMMDAQLPEMQGAVRSPTEIIERMRRLTDDVRGAFGRLYREIIIPLIQRVLDILDQWQLLPDMPQVDNLFVAIQVLSPLAEGQSLEEAERATRWIAAAMQILKPEEVDTIVARRRATRWLHDVMNAPGDVITTPDEEKAASDAIQAALIAGANAEAGGTMPGLTEGQDNAPAPGAPATPA